MKTFALRALIFIAIQLLIVAAVVALRPPARGLYAGIIDKQALLRTAPSPRVIFIGGSNLPFGIDSERIARELPVHPVNMGLITGMGVDFMLTEVKDGLRAGDTVVASFEYPLFGTPPEMRGMNILEGSPSQALVFIRTNPKWLFDNALGVLSLYLRDDVGRFTGRKEVADPVYQRASFNAYGDITTHRNAPRQPLKIVPIKLTGMTEKNIAATIAKLNAFARECRKQGAQLCYLHPGIPAPALQQYRSDFERLDAQMRRTAEFTILNSPFDAGYPEDAFFDSAYHLHGKYVEVRTADLIDRLGKFLAANDAKPTPVGK